MISNFRRAVYDKCGIVGYFATSSVADVSVKSPSAYCSVIAETSVWNYYYSLRKEPQERSSQ